MKKLIAIILALVMALAMTSVAFADGEGEGSTGGDTSKTPISGTNNDLGTITINKYNENNVYSVYQMLVLNSFNTAGQGTYSYTIVDAWKDFFIPVVENGATKEGTGEGAAYVTIDNGYVTWKTGVSDTQAPEFAKKALAYAKAHTDTIDPVAISGDGIVNEDYEIGTISVDGKDWPTYTFKKLNLGYYLVDSTMGALCGLTTTNPNASINAKNGEPTMVKHVKLPNGNWGSENTARIGNVVEFHVDITVAAGAENYVLHDAMEDGLTFVPDSVRVEYDGILVASTDNFTGETALNYTVVPAPAGTPHSGLKCDFEVVFTPAFCNKLAAGKTLIVSYSAVLNANAVIDGAGNKNVAKLAFGEDHFTESSETTTKTYAFDLVKTDAQNSLLDGAEFELYTSASGGEAVSLFWDSTKSCFRPWVSSDGDGAKVTKFVVTGGKIRFQGFAPGDYYFEETKEPAGYNKLTERAKFTLPSANKDAIFNDGVYSSGSGFHITNQSGTMLPETGGIGTLLFTVLGGSTALGTGVVLVTKKRMSKIEDDED